MVSTTKELPRLPEQLMTVKDVAQYLKVSESAVYKWVDEGRLECIDLGQEGRRRCIRFTSDQIRKLILNGAHNN